MPAQRLGADGADIARFDVLGFDSPNLQGFVRHVAIASCDYPSYKDAALRVTHMMPPLLDDAPSPRCHYHGTLGLAEDEAQRIETFVEQIHTEYRAEEERRKVVLGSWTPAAREQFRIDQYTICPHVRRPTEDQPYHRFNCAGFVYETYLEADLDLLRTEDDVLPKCSLAALKTAYPDMAEMLDNPGFRVQQGLEGEGPWPVLLPAYILNAMVRERREILASVYLPKHGDEFFPARSLQENA